MTDKPRPWDRPPSEPLPPVHGPRPGPAPWEPMADRVHQLVQAHPMLEPLRAGVGEGGLPPLVHGYEDALEVVYGWRRSPDHLSVRREAPEWHVPRRDFTEEAWAERIAGHLAAELRRLWDERQAWEVRQQKPGPR